MSQQPDTGLCFPACATFKPMSVQSEHATGAPAEREAPVGEPSWQRVDWRSHQRWELVEGRAVNTIQLGSGPPIVFVHGLSGCWPNWLEQMAVFAESHRVISLDLPGFGHSPGKAGELTMDGYARLLDSLLSGLGFPQATLVGNSMGGLIAAELAASHPSRVERLVLVSPAGLSTYRNRLAVTTLPAIRRLQQLLALGAAWTAQHSDRLAARPRLRDAMLRGVVAHPSRLSSPLAAEQLRGAGTDGFLEALEEITDFDLRPRLALISCPTLVVWGTRDRLVPVRDAASFTELIPGAQQVVYEDTGHMAMLERPDEFNRLLREFLA